MKRLIIATLILLIAAVSVTVIYFNNLNTPAQNTSRVMHTIPADAAFIFEFNNDAGFYDIFKGNKLFAAVVGQESLAELDTLKAQLLLNPQLEHFFTDQNIFISVHPVTNNALELLMTTSAAKKFNTTIIDDLARQHDGNLLVTPMVIDGKKGYTLYSSKIKKRFYLVNTSDNILSGSFSKELVERAAQIKLQKTAVNAFVLLPDQQNANSLGNLYVNYSSLAPLFEQLFQNKNTDIFKSFRLFSGSAAMSLNFKSDALMFSGETDVEKNRPVSYLNLFIDQQSVANHLKDIYPSTTAYSIGFAISDIMKFKMALSQFQVKAGLQADKDQLFGTIKKETGINLVNEFNNLLGNEFAVVTTKYREKLGIITIKDGAKLKSLMYNLGTVNANETGRFNYDKLPYFLLGDAFNVFKKPYFIVLDNYLVLANSTNELLSYRDSYLNHKFLNKTEGYASFDNLLAEKSNVTYFIHFKNIAPLLKTDLNPHFYDIFEHPEPGLNNFYGASYQFTAANNSFYTNFCMKLNTSDTIKTVGKNIVEEVSGN